MPLALPLVKLLVLLGEGEGLQELSGEGLLPLPPEEEPDGLFLPVKTDGSIVSDRCLKDQLLSHALRSPKKC
jgi:hypothetical protein